MRIVTPAVQAPDVIVRHVGDHLQQLRIFAEEVFTDVGTVSRLESLIFAIDAFHHALLQQALGILCEQGIPVGTPDYLDDVPAGTAKGGFQFLDNLAIATNRPSRR